MIKELHETLLSWESDESLGKNILEVREIEGEYQIKLTTVLRISFDKITDELKAVKYFQTRAQTEEGDFPSPTGDVHCFKMKCEEIKNDIETLIKQPLI